MTVQVYLLKALVILIYRSEAPCSVKRESRSDEQFAKQTGLTPALQKNKNTAVTEQLEEL